MRCPCSTGLDLKECCGPLHEGKAAPTAEALMRSRYSAYALRLEQFLLDTWHPTTRPPALNLDEEPRPKWIGLDVLRHESLNGAEAMVEFVARCRIAGRAHRLHELSRFVLEEGCWFYVAALKAVPNDRSSARNNR